LAISPRQSALLHVSQWPKQAPNQPPFSYYQSLLAFADRQWQDSKRVHKQHRAQQLLAEAKQVVWHATCANSAHLQHTVRSCSCSSISGSPGNLKRCRYYRFCPNSIHVDKLGSETFMLMLRIVGKGLMSLET